MGETIGEDNFIIGDMGGTTWDASVVKDRKVSLKVGEWLGDDRLGIKVADVISVGAGGGSIAWIDPLGLLRVGPQSASAMPGPACFGRGGTEPTVTDAAVILGYIDPDNFNGGRLKLQPELSRQAMSKIADALRHEHRGGRAGGVHHGQPHDGRRDHRDIHPQGLRRPGLQPAGHRRRRSAVRTFCGARSWVCEGP